MIELKNVYFQYGVENKQNTSVLKNINLTINDGELVLVQFFKILNHNSIM